MAELVEQVRLDELGLRKWRGHLQQRLTGEHHIPLRNRAHLTLEDETEEGFEVPYRAVQRGGELVDVFALDTVFGEEVQGGLQARRDQEAPARWEVPDEEAEGGRGPHVLA